MDFFAQARRQMLAGQLEDERARLLASIAGLTPEEMALPGVCGEWSIRDILAHVAAWDRAQTAGYRKMLAGNHPAILDFSEEEIDEFNAKNHAATAGVDLEGTLAELNAARQEMVDFLRGVDNAQLFAPAPGDEHADLSIAAQIQVSISHDEEHAEMIENWVEERVGAGG